MKKEFGCQSMTAPLRRVIVKTPESAFENEEQIARQWQDLGYTGRPDLQRAANEHRFFVSILQKHGAEIFYLDQDHRAGLDSIYAHDAGLITDQGAIIFQTGKATRRGEGPALMDALQRWNVSILGAVDGNATAEGGDMVWLDQKTLLVGVGFRTNAAGVEQLRAMLRKFDIRVMPFDLPYWNGPADVLHLMSFLSLLDDDLAVIYPRLMPVPLYQMLKERRIQLVTIPEEEFDTQACNVLALAPRTVLMLKGNPITKAKLMEAGCRVEEYEGDEISMKGSGGPTCLPRPLLRA